MSRNQPPLRQAIARHLLESDPHRRGLVAIEISSALATPLADVQRALDRGYVLFEQRDGRWRLRAGVCEREGEIVKDFAHGNRAREGFVQGVLCRMCGQKYNPDETHVCGEG